MQSIDEHIITQLKKSVPAKVGLQIRKYRELKRLTQTELALMIGKDRQYVYKIEKGKVAPTIVTIAVICAALEIQLKELFSEINIII